MIRPRQAPGRKWNKLLRIDFVAIKRSGPSRELLTLVPYLWYYGHKGRGARCLYGTLRRAVARAAGGRRCVTLRTLHTSNGVMKRPFILITIYIWIFHFPCNVYQPQLFLCYLIIFPGKFSIKKKKEKKRK